MELNISKLLQTEPWNKSTVKNQETSTVFTYETDIFNLSDKISLDLDIDPIPIFPKNVSEESSLPIDMRFNEGHILLISCYSSILVVSLIGNLCVLSAILGARRQQRKSRVNLMLLHLAIADLIVSKYFSWSFFKNYINFILKTIELYYRVKYALLTENSANK